MTKLDICNAALIHCGAEPINSLTDESKRARLVSIRYDQIKEVLLAKYSWNFAKVRAVLEEDSEKPAFEYSARYALPSDYVRVFKLEDDTIKFKEEGKYLLTDASGELKLTYVKNAVETEFNAMFSEVLSLAIADSISYSLVQSNTLKQRISEDYKELLREARSYNSQAGNGDAFIADTYTMVRY